MQKMATWLSVLLIAGGLPAQTFTGSNLPIVIIDTHGQTIPDEEKIAADMKVIWNDGGRRNYLSDPANEYDGKIGIEIRGSSSQMFPKKQYAVETRDDDGENLDVELLGFPEENDWILYAPYSDKSLMRNVLAYKMSNDMGRYASRTCFVEMVLNGSYNGVYVLMEKIKRDKGRVDINNLKPEEISGDDLTGGYLIKVDKWTGEDNDGWTSSYRPYSGAWQTTTYQYHIPKPDEIVFQQRQYIHNYMNEFESLMKSSFWNDPVNGYYSFVNFQSFVDVFILGEVSKNVDAFRLSAYMHKDKASIDNRLTMGPIWDYNLAFGNADYYQGWETEGFQLDIFFENGEFLNGDPFCAPFWWRTIRQDPVFMQAVAKRYFDLRETILLETNILADIDSIAALLNESQARNFQRWPVLAQYIWPNAYIGSSWTDELNYLKSWTIQRLDWMDDELVQYVSVEQGVQPQLALFCSAYPNPFNNLSVISYILPASGRVTVSMFNVNGELIVQNDEGFQQTGQHTYVLDGGILPSGIYFYRLDLKEFNHSRPLQTTRKIVCLK